MMRPRLLFIYALFVSVILSSCRQESDAPTVAPDRGRFAPQPTPRGALERHLEILYERIKDPSLSLYTRKSQKFLRLHLVTDTQQRLEWEAVAGIISRAEEITRSDLAVVRFPLDPQVPPYLLRRSEKGWMLDIAAMSSLIGFNADNRWYFRTQSHPWAFAFADWQFDSHGVPLARNGSETSSLSIIDP